MILVADRELPPTAFMIRRELGDSIGAEFARWLASLERGRFLTITLPCPPESEPLWSWQNLEGLVEYMAQGFIAGHRDWHVYAAPDVREKLEQLAREINVLVGEGAPRVSP